MPTGQPDSLGPIVILTALGEEYVEVRKTLTDLSSAPGITGTAFEVGRLVGSGHVVAVAATGRGVLAAATVTQQAATLFEPRAMLFVGIAGGLRQSLNLGDVVIGAPVLAFGGGREDPDGFKPEPTTWLPSPILRQPALHLAAQGDWSAVLAVGRPELDPPRAYLAPIASGDILLNNRDSETGQRLSKFYPTAAAIEMESAGFAEAAAENGIAAIAVRGISDFADGSKPTTDRAGWRISAATHAAAFAAALIRALPTTEADPTRRGLELALLRAVWQYATTNSALMFAAPWLPRDGLRTDMRIWSELIKAIESPQAVDTALIGQIWQAHLAEGAVHVDLPIEAAVLVGYFRDQAQRMTEFRLTAPPPADASASEPPAGQPTAAMTATPAADARAARAADTATVVSAVGSVLIEGQLADARGDLAGVTDLLNSGVVDNPMPPAIRMHRYDQTATIERETRWFVGREFIYQQIGDFLQNARSGYACVVAHPGVGKTAMLAELIRRERCAHHFNQLTEGIVAPATFLRNICAQLVAAYRLPDTELPPRAGENSGYLYELLGRAVAASPDQRVIVAIDALDESDRSRLLPGTNPLYLPKDLPRGCFVVLTTRPEDAKESLQPPRLSTSTDVDVRPILVEQEDPRNLADISRFITTRVDVPGIVEYRSRHGLTADSLVKHITGKSDGNFMYLRQLLLDIELGQMIDRELASIPTGLRPYYSDQLERMRGSGGMRWHEVQLPVIAALSLAGRPLTAAQIAVLTGVPPARVSWALQSFGQFLRASYVTVHGRTRLAHSIYHETYQEFLLQYTAATEADLLDDIIKRFTRRRDETDQP